MTTENMLNEKTGLDMDKVCRSCLQESEEMRSIFEIKDNLLLSQMIMECTSVKLEDDDGLPKYLCSECELKLEVAYNFKLQFEKSDLTLRQCSQSNPDDAMKLSVEDDNSNDNDVRDEATYSGSDLDARGSSDIETEDRKCIFCPKLLATAREKRTHEKLHREPSDEMSHTCNECGLSFSRPYHLAKHKKDHKTITITIKQEGDDDGTASEELNGQIEEIILERKDKNFECEVCRKVLTTYVGLKIHMRRHTGLNLYGCNVCQKTFTKGSHMKRHMRSAHGIEYTTEKPQKTIQKRTMECEFCDRKFKYRKSFNHHMITEHGMEDYDSDTPLSKLLESPESQDLEPKVEISVQDGTYEATINPASPDEQKSDESRTKAPKHNHVCHVCDCHFTRSNHLTRHMTLHRAVLTHKCDLCDKAFASQEFLDKHHQEDHINKPYTCTMCNRTFSRGEHLIRHLKVHMPNEKNANSLKCSICMKEFSRPDHLARHIKIHLQQDKRHVCNECGKAFNRLDNLKTHQRIHTGQKDNSKLHLCVYCGKEFNNSSNMIVHMRRHTGERPYKCSQCGKGFPRSHDLKCHERIHSGEKPYLCTLCGKSFNKSNKLLRHTRVHTGERPYVCNLCGRAFTQSNDLALHMRRHTGSRPYACGVCPARFIQSGQLKAHRRSTGHWMETQPDLKGGHRVEPVTALTEPIPIKFKTHGKVKLEEEDAAKEDERKKDQLKQTARQVGIMENLIMQPQSQPLLIDNTKLLEQFPQLTNLAAALNSNFVIQSESGSIKDEQQVKIVTLASGQTFQAYTATTTSHTLTNTDAVYNYQSYG